MGEVLDKAATAKLSAAAECLRRVPLIDGHNDLPMKMRSAAAHPLDQTDLNIHQAALHTDIPRLRRGCLGGQFWALFPSNHVDDATALIHCLEGFSVVYRMCERYADDFGYAAGPTDVLRVWQSGRIAALIGVEGGRVLNGSLDVLRMLRRMGACYLTLTHTLSHSWADSATDAPRHGGLTDFGHAVIHEMNRIGMMIDLSHTAPSVMRAVLGISRLPVVFTHANAYALNPHPRNVPDDVLEGVAASDGLVMVTFVPAFLNVPCAEWSERRDAFRKNLLQRPGLKPEMREAMLRTWVQEHPQPAATLADVADHIDYLVKAMGIRHVGIGSDFDGIREVPLGLEDTACFPNLVAELMRRGYGMDDLEKILSGNLLRVMHAHATAAA